MPVVINQSDAEILVGQSLTLNATVNASNNQQVNWSVASGSDYVSVAQDGTVLGLAVGTAVVRATSAENENNYDEITVTVLDPNNCGKEVPSNNLENGYTLAGASNISLAVDIDVTGSQFTIESVEPSVVNFATEFEFIFYSDNNGFPGERITSVNGTIVDDVVTGTNYDYWFHKYKVNLDIPVTLNTGKYWMEMKSNAVAWETTTASLEGLPLAFKGDTTNGEWTYAANNNEGVYKIDGVCATLGINESTNESKLSYYPNPVTDYLTIEAQKPIENVVVYNLAGQQIKTQKLNQEEGKLNLTSLPAGVYMIQTLFKDGQFKTFKVIKK
jgi:hypothetical protein